eukprot:CAMPEP_0115861820 /NCGR_PEP_ID=MMETSP0287-20121206/17854_1 /TAXON_ID=412157 /ORGANISM="Chrysochromulina rotalis, Strain UIO044" /LENGTH=257 /DNA_ID=CAMNT_0003316215 /DNA_START=66 /DNA_END=839 /DNA_ORIENTATION=+
MHTTGEMPEDDPIEPKVISQQATTTELSQPTPAVELEIKPEAKALPTAVAKLSITTQNEAAAAPQVGSASVAVAMGDNEEAAVMEQATEQGAMSQALQPAEQTVEPPPLLHVRPAWGFCSHSEWAPSKPFVTHALAAEETGVTALVTNNNTVMLAETLAAAAVVQALDNAQHPSALEPDAANVDAATTFAAAVIAQALESRGVAEATAETVATSPRPWVKEPMFTSDSFKVLLAPEGEPDQTVITAPTYDGGEIYSI